MNQSNNSQNNAREPFFTRPPRKSSHNRQISSLSPQNIQYINDIQGKISINRNGTVHTSQLVTNSFQNKGGQSKFLQGEGLSSFGQGQDLYISQKQNQQQEEYNDDQGTQSQQNSSDNNTEIIDENIFNKYNLQGNSSQQERSKGSIKNAQSQKIQQIDNNINISELVSEISFDDSQIYKEQSNNLIDLFNKYDSQIMQQLHGSSQMINNPKNEQSFHTEISEDMHESINDHRIVERSKNQQSKRNPKKVENSRQIKTDDDGQANNSIQHIVEKQKNYQQNNQDPQAQANDIIQKQQEKNAGQTGISLTLKLLIGLVTILLLCLLGYVSISKVKQDKIIKQFSEQINTQNVYIHDLNQKIINFEQQMKTEPQVKFVYIQNDSMVNNSSGDHYHHSSDQQQQIYQEQSLNDKKVTSGEPNGSKEHQQDIFEDFKISEGQEQSQNSDKVKENMEDSGQESEDSEGSQVELYNKNQNSLIMRIHNGIVSQFEGIWTYLMSIFDSIYFF